jgi:hypothetical protein
VIGCEEREIRVEAEGTSSCVQGSDDGKGCGDFSVAVRGGWDGDGVRWGRLSSRLVDVMKKEMEEGQESEFEAEAECCD